MIFMQFLSIFIPVENLINIWYPCNMFWERFLSFYHIFKTLIVFLVCSRVQFVRVLLLLFLFVFCFCFYWDLINYLSHSSWLLLNFPQLTKNCCPFLYDPVNFTHSSPVLQDNDLKALNWMQEVRLPTTNCCS